MRVNPHVVEVRRRADLSFSFRPSGQPGSSPASRFSQVCIGRGPSKRNQCTLRRAQPGRGALAGHAKVAGCLGGHPTAALEPRRGLRVGRTEGEEQLGASRAEEEALPTQAGQDEGAARRRGRHYRPLDARFRAGSRRLAQQQGGRVRNRSLWQWKGRRRHTGRTRHGWRRCKGGRGEQRWRHARF